MGKEEEVKKEREKGEIKFVDCELFKRVVFTFSLPRLTASLCTCRYVPFDSFGLHLQGMIDDEINMCIYFFRLRQKSKDVAERRRIKSLGCMIRLGGNGTPKRTSLYRIILPIVLSKCQAQKWTETKKKKKLL